MRTLTRSILLLFLVGFLSGSVFAQAMSIKEIRQAKAEVVKYQKDIKTLQAKAKKTKDVRAKNVINATIDLYKERIVKLKDKLYGKTEPVKPAVLLSSEVTPIVVAPETEEAVVKDELAQRDKKPALFEIGAEMGVFAGGSANLIAEARLPLRMVIGPAKLGLRVASGYVQDQSGGRKYVPVNLDLIFNFPPGWFTGTNNYIGFGLNYVALTSGRVAGTVGGEVFYGVESEGFGGTVFGEMGYTILRTGFSPSQKGITVLIGYRTGFGI